MKATDLRILVLGALLAATGAGRAEAGAWTQERGHGIAILKTTYDRAPVAFDAEGRPSEPRAFQKIEGELYAEWGFRDGLTVVVAPTVQAVHDRTTTDDRRATGLAFTELGARLRLWQTSHSVVSVQPLLVLPGTMGASGNAVLGSGHTDMELRVLAGRNFSLFGLPVFLDLEGAYRGRGGRAPDEWRADTALGVTLGPRWQIMTQTFSVFGTESFTLHKAQMSLVQRWSPCTSFEVGVWRALAGRDVVREEAAFASIWFRL